MDRLPAGPHLTQVINDFLADTDDQLWTDRNELIDFASTHIDRYLVGELGNNLIYTSRVRILTDALNDLADLALRAASVVLDRHRSHDSTLKAFLTEAIEYHRLQLTDVFAGSGHPALTQHARFDVKAYLETPAHLPIADVALPQPMIRRFWLDPEQVAVVNGYLGRFGDTAAGAGRLLSKVHLSDLLRRTELIGDLPATPS
jgi:hypothetical protein